MARHYRIRKIVDASVTARHLRAMRDAGRIVAAPWAAQFTRLDLLCEILALRRRADSTVGTPTHFMPDLDEARSQDPGVEFVTLKHRWPSRASRCRKFP